MSQYQIKQYSRDRAKELNVKIKPSSNPKKKIDVFDKNDKFIVSVGANGYSDYPTYLQQGDKALADKRKQLYKARHKKDRKVVGSAGYYADQILW
jgi:hypothetical protein